MNAAMKGKLTQAYKQAPWRKQVQRIAFFMMAVITIALIAGIYLNISAQTAEAGVAIQKLQVTRSALQRANADLAHKLAENTTLEKMKKRAEELGFEPINSDSVEYVIIPAYNGRQASISKPINEQADFLPHPIIKPMYTQSLWEWLLHEMATLNTEMAGEGK